MLEELKKALKENRVTIGTETTIKGILRGEVKKVVIAKNCPEEIKKRLEYYKKVGEIEVFVFDGTNKDLGAFCGKPFGVSVVGIKYG